MSGLKGVVIDASVLIKALRVDDIVRKHDRQFAQEHDITPSPAATATAAAAAAAAAAVADVTAAASVDITAGDKGPESGVTVTGSVDGIALFTVPEVLQEVRNHFARNQLQFTPYDFTLREPSGDFMRLAIDFAKATGDFYSLSTNDLKVIALTCQLEWELAGRRVDPAPSRPVILQGRPPLDAPISSTLPPQKLPEGFYHPHDPQGGSSTSSVSPAPSSSSRTQVFAALTSFFPPWSLSNNPFGCVETSRGRGGSSQHCHKRDWPASSESGKPSC